MKLYEFHQYSEKLVVIDMNDYLWDGFINNSMCYASS